MPITLFDVTQRRLNNQHLLRPSLLTPQAVVSWLVAVQSQDYTGAKWSVGQRMPTATDAVLDEAFNTGAILRTHVLRPTWHFVAPADIRWLLMLTAPRVHAVNGTMYRQTGLDEAMLGQSAAIITHGFAGGKRFDP
ncbi:MAG: crosslink repair DNA glycosylase YcaQ family protein [Candidatus Promineifilaceae bacterium]